MANEHLLNVPDGDTQAAFSVDFQGYIPGEQRVSGRDLPGRYKAEITECATVNKKDRPGKNFALRLLLLPSRIGVRAYHPAPVGSPGDPVFESGMRNVRDLVWSIATGTGQVDKLKAGPITLNPAWFVGKHCYVRIDDDEYNGRVTSKITAYITKDEFDGAPGPDAAVAASRPQPTVPEVFGGAVAPAGGNAGPKSAIDKVLGF